MRGVPHSDETRAAALAALLAGQSVNEVARQYRLSNATVIAWREAAGLHSTPVEPQKREDISELVATFLRETLTTVSVLAVQFRDPTWLKQQNAADAAVLFGVISDKGFRLLEAIDSIPSEGPSEPSP